MTSSADPAATRLWTRAGVWLVILVVVFFSISLYLGAVSYYDFQLDNSVDAGIITQAVASTAHGGVTPFFESWDCLFKERCSFLLVHPSFVMYAEVPAFAAFPSTLTLFAIRAAIVAAAAIPLFWLTRQLTGSGRMALLAAGLYLVWAPTSADDFSLHMESFLPFEILLLVALWQAGRYRWGLLVAGVTFITLEVGPVFTFLVGVFFLAPSFGGLTIDVWGRWRNRRQQPFSVPNEWRESVSAARGALRRASVRYTLALMIASVAGYVLLFAFLNDWGHVLLHVPAPNTGTGLAGLFYNSSTQPAASLGTILTSWQTLGSAEYWLLLLALAGFLPFFAPRAWILILPWMGWTFLTNSSRFTTLGRQYSFVAAGPIFVGVAFGLQYLYRRYQQQPTGPAVDDSSPTARRRWSLTRRRSTLLVGACVGAIVAANILMLPFDPVLPHFGFMPGEPIQPTYFDHSLEIQPGWLNIEHMLGIVPPNATVGAPSDLYALIATHPGAVILRGRDEGNTQFLPFNYSGGPDFALLYPSAVRPLDAKEWGNLSNPALYGMRAYVASSTLGPIYLYARAFSGIADPFGPVLPSVNSTWTPQDGLTAGSNASTIPNASSPSGYVIESDLSAHSTGLIWNGSAAVLGPGTYTVTVNAAIAGTSGTIRPSTTVLALTTDGFAVTPMSRNVTYGELSSATWVSVTWNFTITSPLPTYTVEGILRDPDCAVAVASVQITPDP